MSNETNPTKEYLMKRFLTTITAALVLAATANAEVRLEDFKESGDRGWGPAVQRAIDSLVDPKLSWPEQGGGRIVVDKGRHDLYPPSVIVRCPGIIIVGEGTTNASRSCTFERKGTDPTEAMCIFVGPDAANKGPSSAGFQMENIHLWGNSLGTAFRFGPKGRYVRGFKFENVSFRYFDKVFEVMDGPQRTWGGLVCRDCTMQYNGQILVALGYYSGVDKGGCVNEFLFDNCLLSRNGLATEKPHWPPAYAFDLFGGDQGRFRDCILEGQPLALRARRFQNLILDGCRFEANAQPGGKPVVLVEDCRGVWINRCHHRVV